MTTTLNRFDYIDIAKGIGILMVVWAHILLTGWTHKIIYAFHMPLFFLLSGMLFKKEKYNSFGIFFMRRAKRLLVPYVIYSVVTWAIWAAFRYIRHDEVDSYIMPLLQTFFAQGSGAFFVHNSALWFIPCLFLVEFLYFFISKLGRARSLVFCFALAAVSFLLGHAFGDNYWFTLPWNADAALIALPFYCVGNQLIEAVGHKKIISHITNNKWQYVFYWLSMTALLWWSSMTFSECSMGSSLYGCNGTIFFLRAFLGCSWLILLAIFLGNMKDFLPIRYFKWAGRKSLDIMCVHIPLKGICMILVAKALQSSVDFIDDNLAYSAIAFIITMITCWFAIRFFVENVNKLGTIFSKL